MAEESDLYPWKVYELKLLQDSRDSAFGRVIEKVQAEDEDAVAPWTHFIWHLQMFASLSFQGTGCKFPFVAIYLFSTITTVGTLILFGHINGPTISNF